MHMCRWYKFVYSTFKYILHSSFHMFYIFQFEKSHDTRKWEQLFPFSVALLCPRLEV